MTLNIKIKAYNQLYKRPRTIKGLGSITYIIRLTCLINLKNYFHSISEARNYFCGKIPTNREIIFDIFVVFVPDDEASFIINTPIELPILLHKP